MSIRRRIGFAALAVIGVLVVAALVIVFRPAWTPSVSGPEPIASIEQVTLGGDSQTILIRGRDKSNPILLFLHGGPGMPMMYLAHEFREPLESHFVVVHWDQLGAGKSYRADIDPAKMRVSRMLSDAEELIRYLQQRFGRRQIYLVGHSWGSMLGMLLAERHPDWLCAYVGVGQVVDSTRADPIQRAFIERRAREANDTEALAQLAAGELDEERWLFEYGAELYGETSFWPLIRSGLTAPEYTFREAMRVKDGSSFSSRHMRYDVIDGELATAVRRVEVPVFFFQGRHDYVTPSELAASYLDELSAPAKQLIWFERSAHFPFFEQPTAFSRALIDRVRTSCGVHPSIGNR